jgi:hypothetical protein
VPSSWSQALETSITEKRPLVDDRVFCFPGILQLPSIYTIATRTITAAAKNNFRLNHERQNDLDALIEHMTSGSKTTVQCNVSQEPLSK